MPDKQRIINKMDKPKRYYEGIDCAWCNEKEPCIYKIANELEEKLLRKEQECEELKKQVEVIKERLFRKIAPIDYTDCPYYIKMVKLKQTLAEIKEIAKENIRIADLEGLNGVYRRGLATQILQKICEVEN